MSRLVVGPFNRVEGDLEVTLEVEDGKVANAQINAPLFRGFEAMLTGKDPRDALTITPRICGICSISQSHAAAKALASLAGVEPPGQGKIVTNIIHGAENLADHVTHFYLFFMSDFTREAYQSQSWYEDASRRFGDGGDGGEGVRAMIGARANFMHIMGMLAGKWPHTLAIQPGGVTYAPSERDRLRLLAILREFRKFLEVELFGGPLEEFLAIKTPGELDDWKSGDLGLFVRINDGCALDKIGRSGATPMSFGAYGGAFGAGLWSGQLEALKLETIIEDIKYSWMKGASAHPRIGHTIPDEEMSDPGYSWCKAPRMNGKVMETGAYARQLVDGNPLARALWEDGSSVYSRVIGRVIEIARMQCLLESWVRALKPEEIFIQALIKLPDGEGVGIVEAARGALGHWLRVEKGRIANYQIVAPTSWNFSPRDDQGQPGAAEAALIGAPVGAGEDTPVSVQHIIRSFDPCMVCTVH